jgi:hypothetical protein
MANARPSGQKRLKERARQEKQKEKEARRLEAKARKANAPPRTGDEDPDLAGITPGPHNQPPLVDSGDE